MQQFTHAIIDPAGIHARPAAKLVKEIGTYASTVTISKGDKKVDARKLISIMGLGAKQGDEITLTIEGDDETEASEKLKTFLSENI